MRISHYIVLFVIYSFLGWFYESFICSKIFQKKFINRGFLLGPYCPIYGTGAVLCNIVFSTPQDSNVFVIFISCAVGACIIEYITSYIMEKLFNTRWWDYSKLPFNLNGRICLYGALVFGFAGMGIAFITPYIESLFVKYIENRFIDRISILIFMAMTADFATTIASWHNLNSSLGKIRASLNNGLNEKREEFNEKREELSQKIEKKIYEAHQKALFIETKYKDGIVVHSMDMKKRLNVPINKNAMRFIKAFPSLKSDKYNDIIEHIREEVRKSHMRGE